MRVLLLIPLLIVLSISFSFAQDAKSELRTWTSIIGTKVEAELVSLTGNQVTLKTKAGKTIKLPLNKLSKTDQEFLKAKSSPKEPIKEEAPVKPNLEYEVKDSGVTITRCDKEPTGALIIPLTIEGKAVTSIGNYAFDDCERLTSITIPDSVTSIGSKAFSGCERLTTITIPDSVTSIGKDAFTNCNSLTSITIPDSITSIENWTFKGCKSLTRITIPDSVTSIGIAVFQGCTSLTSITIPDSVTSIEEAAFAGCRSLSSVTFLGNAPKVSPRFLIAIFDAATPTIYRNAEAKGWGDTFAGRPVKLISEKP